jgi:hypothetical protein
MPLGRLSVLPSHRADKRDTAGHHGARAPTNSFSLIKSLMIVVSLLGLLHGHRNFHSLGNKIGS